MLKHDHSYPMKINENCHDPFRLKNIPGTVSRPVSQARFKAHQPTGRESRMLSTRFSGALRLMGKHWETRSWMILDDLG